MSIKKIKLNVQIPIEVTLTSFDPGEREAFDKPACPPEVEYDFELLGINDKKLNDRSYQDGGMPYALEAHIRAELDYEVLQKVLSMRKDSEKEAQVDAAA